MYQSVEEKGEGEAHEMEDPEGRGGRSQSRMDDYLPGPDSDEEAVRPEKQD
ncbi:unnamed protein product, partial [marine sediment metagenome]